MGHDNLFSILMGYLIDALDDPSADWAFVGFSRQVRIFVAMEHADRAKRIVLQSSEFARLTYVSIRDGS